MRIITTTGHGTVTRSFRVKEPRTGGVPKAANRRYTVVAQITRTGIPETLSVTVSPARKTSKPAAIHDVTGPIVSIRITLAPLSTAPATK